MKLTQEQQAILDGKQGAVLAKVMKTLVQYGELFGAERMVSALNERPDAAPQDVLKNVRRAVDAFVRGAEQFDDLTMLCLEYKGPKKETGDKV